MNGLSILMGNITMRIMLRVRIAMIMKLFVVFVSKVLSQSKVDVLKTALKIVLNAFIIMVNFSVLGVMKLSKEL